MLEDNGKETEGEVVNTRGETHCGVKWSGVTHLKSKERGGATLKLYMDAITNEAAGWGVD